MKNKGDLLIFSTMFIFGGYGLFLRFFPNISTLSFLFFFQLVGMIGFALLLSRKGFSRINPKSFALILSLSLFVLVADLLYFLSFRLTSIANAAIAHQMSTVFLVFLAPLLLKEKTVKNEWITFFLSLLGLIILYSKSIDIGLNDFQGITLSLLSAVLSAFVILHYRVLPKRGLSIIIINFWRFTISTILLLPVIIAFGGFTFSSQDLLPLSLFGLLFAVIGSGIHNFGISQTKAIRASIIGKSEPVIASFYAFLFLKEIPSFETLIGGVLIIFSSLWLALKSNN